MALKTVQETIEATRLAYLRTWQEIQRWAAVLGYLDSDVATLRRELASLRARVDALEARR